MIVNDINSKPLNVWSSGKSASGKVGADLDLTAPTLVFVHGLGSGMSYYYSLLPTLLPKANAVLIDTTGAAQSPVSKVEPTLDSLVGDVNAVMDHFGIERDVILVGHSMGGMVVLRAAELDGANGLTARIIKIVLMGPLHPGPGVADAFKSRIEGIQAQGNSVLGLADTVPESALGSKALPLHKAFVRALISQQPADGYIGICRVIIHAEPPAYDKITVPALFLLGEEDKSTPYEGCVDVIVKNYKGDTTVHKYEGVGHWIPVEVSDKAANAIYDFI